MATTPDNLEFVLESVTVGDRAPTERVAAIEATHRPWVGGEGVQALGIGPKITDGVDTGELALRVYVEEKRADRRLDHPVPKRVDTPEAVRDGASIVTDVIEIGRLGTELFTGRSDPVAPGIGIGNPIDDNVGTLGAIVRRRHDGTRAILSNAHVLARDGLAELGEEIVQPSTVDGGEPGVDRVAHLAAFHAFEFTETGFPNLVDAAIADVNRQRAHVDRIRELGHAPKGITKGVRRGMHVHKMGRTSDLTVAIIQDVHFRLQFRLRRTRTRRARVGFRRQVMCTRFTGPGDSGSLVLSSSGRAVGLHFAGSPTASVFNRIDHVLDALDVDLVLDGDE